MAPTVAAWRTSRQRKRWDALSSAEQEKALDVTVARNLGVSERDKTLSARFLADRMREEQIGSIAEFKQAFPDDYIVARLAFRRDLALRPPTHAESGGAFTGGLVTNRGGPQSQ